MRKQHAYRLCTFLFFVTGALAIACAGYSGFAFSESPNDQVLIQMVFYGAWTSLVGAWVGGIWGARLEEDCCSSTDMGVLSCMGAFFGALAGGLIGTAATGLALQHGWIPVFAVTVVLGSAHGASAYFLPLDLRRRSHVTARGLLTGPDGALLDEQHQPLRMKERAALLMALAAVVLLGLTLKMALMMGVNLGHPAMMAPMMYGMLGTMAGGMLGGWLSGVLDEHQGAPEHDNPIMVCGMALMAGMMGAMPAGMVGGMMGVMGDKAIAITVAAGVAFGAISAKFLLWERYEIVRWTGRIAAAGGAGASGAPYREAIAETKEDRDMDTIGGSSLRVKGMSCDGCVTKITGGVQPLAGITYIEVNLATATVSVRWGEGFVGMDAVRTKIQSLGYQVA